MKHKISFKRAAGFALTAAMGLACLWPGSTAKAADITIDTSAWSNPQKTETTIYKWTPGLPRNMYNNHDFNKKFPTLITWDDAYYMKVDLSFAYCIENNLHLGGERDGYSTDNNDVGQKNGFYTETRNGWPSGGYNMDLMYTGGLLSDVDGADYSAVADNNYFYSMDIPNGIINVIPVYYEHYEHDDGTESEKIHYALEVDLPENSVWYPSTYQSGNRYSYRTHGGLREGENYLAAIRKDYSEHRTETSYVILETHYWTKTYCWTLYGMNTNDFQNGTADQLLYRGGTYNFSDTAFNKSNFPSHDRADNPYNGWDFHIYFGWVGDQFTGDDGRIYNTFVSQGTWLHEKEFDYCGSCSGHNEFKNLTNSLPDIALAHNGSYLESCGGYAHLLDYYFHVWGTQAVRDFYSFRCFYAQPYTISCYSTGFTVENGQVCSLDGPLAITNNAQIVVKDGGTLSVDGWVMNNGCIKVEEGGTLYVQDGACLCRFNDGTNYGGGIISNGLVIVGEGAKLIGGGADGIQLLNGSHVVNYGCVASENFKVVNDHTIENRDKGFVLHGAGNGVTNCGNQTYQSDVNYSTDSSGHYTGTYAEQGQVLDVCEDNVDSVANAIYWN